MIKFNIFFFLWSLIESESFVSVSQAIRGSETKIHGGFGFGASSSKQSKRKNECPRRSNTLKKKPEKSSGPSDEEPSAKGTAKLDKWGLPIPTEEEVLEQLFPPMPEGTELIPVDPLKKYSLFEIQSYLKGHVDLKLKSRFDMDGVEEGSDEPHSMALRLLHQSPPVLAIDNFLSSYECKELKSATSSGHEVSSATFTGSLSTRTSTSWFCNYSDVPVLLAKSNAILNIPLETMEEPQVVRYQKGEEFSWHYDEVPAKNLKNGGQRVATLLVYLNDVDARSGGGTAFRDLTYREEPLVMQPKEGSALLFFPAFADGKPDDRTLHRSEAMSGSGEKWIIQMWTHEGKYSAALPIGNSNDSACQIMNEKIEELGFNK